MLVAFEKLILIWHNWNSAKTRNHNYERVFFSTLSSFDTCKLSELKFQSLKFINSCFSSHTSVNIFRIFIHFFLTFGNIGMKPNDFFDWRINFSFYLCGQYWALERNDSNACVKLVYSSKIWIKCTVMTVITSVISAQHCTVILLCIG